MVWKFREDGFKLLRQIGGLTQKQAAARMGIEHAQQWSSWERGDCLPNLGTIIDVANKFQCDPSFFFVNDVDLNHKDEN